jgi:transposase
MPWETKDIMRLREEFVYLAMREDVNRRALCRRFGISPQTAYKWLARFSNAGLAGLADQSRRPHHSPALTPTDVQSAVVKLRTQHPAWGGRKISRRLQDMGQDTVAPSTVSTILHRHGMMAPMAESRQAWQRFEHASPNALWQADFKGYFDTLRGRCMPLTVLDDHSRFNLLLQACGNTRTDTVQTHLKDTFRRYGLPARMNFDNGAPWGSPGQPGQVTALSLWLIRLGIRISLSALAIAVLIIRKPMVKKSAFIARLKPKCSMGAVLRVLPMLSRPLMAGAGSIIMSGRTRRFKCKHRLAVISRVFEAFQKRCH